MTAASGPGSMLAGPRATALLSSRSLSIAGGTTEVNKTIVADGRHPPFARRFDAVLLDGRNVVVDMPTLFQEIDTLESRGISCARLLVSSHAHLIFPYHQELDVLFWVGCAGSYDDRYKKVTRSFAELMEKAGQGRMRVMTDFVADRYWTVVSDFEVESLDAFEKMMSGEGSGFDEETLRQMDELMKGYHDLVDFGRREIYKLEN